MSFLSAAEAPLASVAIVDTTVAVGRLTVYLTVVTHVEPYRRYPPRRRSTIDGPGTGSWTSGGAGSLTDCNLTSRAGTIMIEIGTSWYPRITGPTPTPRRRAGDAIRPCQANPVDPAAGVKAAR